MPGDIIEVNVGSKVPADARVIRLISQCIRVDQAILTGESHSVAKDEKICSTPLGGKALAQDKTNM